MGRRHNRPSGGEQPTASWESERTLADVEADQTDSAATESDTLCPCGSSEFLLEAYLHVVDGRPKPKPVEIETLTCPQCGREFEAVETEDGRILRGDFRGYVEIEE